MNGYEMRQAVASRLAADRSGDEVAGEPGRMAWPAAVLVIAILAGALWYAVIEMLRYVFY